MSKRCRCIINQSISSVPMVLFTLFFIVPFQFHRKPLLIRFALWSRFGLWLRLSVEAEIASRCSLDFCRSWAVLALFSIGNQFVSILFISLASHKWFTFWRRLERVRCTYAVCGANLRWRFSAEAYRAKNGWKYIRVVYIAMQPSDNKSPLLLDKLCMLVRRRLQRAGIVRCFRNVEHGRQRWKWLSFRHDSWLAAPKRHRQN